MDSTIIGLQNLIVMRVFIAERRSKRLVFADFSRALFAL